MELEEQDSFIAIWWPTGKRTHSKMFIDSSERFVPSKLIYTLSGIQSHPNSIPITKRSWTTKHRPASSASSIVRWLIDSLAMDWLRSRTTKSSSHLTYWSNVQSINTSSRISTLRSCKFKITLFLYLKQKIHHFIFFWHSLHALSWIEIIPPQWGQVYFAFCCIIKLSNP